MRIVHKFDTENLQPPVILQYEDSTNTLYANGRSLSGGDGGGADSVVTDPTADQSISGAHALILSDAGSSLYVGTSDPFGGLGDSAQGFIGAPEASQPAQLQGWFGTSQLEVSSLVADSGSALGIMASGSGSPIGMSIAIAGSGTGGQTEIMDADAFAIGSSTNALFGAKLGLQNHGSGIIPEATTFYAVSPTNDGGGSIALANGLHVLIQSGSGITDSNGILIDDQGATKKALTVKGGLVNLGPQATTVGSLVTKDSSFGSFDPTSQYKVVIQGDDTSIGGFEALGIYTSSNNSGHNELDFLTSRGTNASPTAVQTGDQLMSIATPAVYGTAWTSTMNQVELFGEVYDASQHAGWLQFYIISDKFGDPLNPPNFSTMFALAGDGNSIIGPHVAEAGSGVGSTLAADADSTLTIENKLTIGTGQGITTHNIRSGPNQSTTDLTQWQAANKLVLTKIKSDGNLVITNMATSDPHVVGQLYNVAGVVHISAG